MKSKILVILLLSCVIAAAQSTNFFWSANKTSNEIHSAISSRLGTNTSFVLNISTGAPPNITLFFGLTTNVPITQLGVTNYLWFTNGVLTLVTNSST